MGCLNKTAQVLVSHTNAYLDILVADITIPLRDIYHISYGSWEVWKEIANVCYAVEKGRP